jgi:hypothetical protein
MSQPIRIPAATLRCAAVLGLGAVLLTGALAGPALADNDNRNRAANEHRQEQARHEQVRQEQARQHAVQARGREQHRYDDYYRRPDVYYSAPPVVYQPQGYAVQPGASLNFNFPLVIR